MSDCVVLVEPSVDYQEAFGDMVLEYKNHGEADYYDMYEEALHDFGAYVMKLHNNAKGIDIPEDWVPSHTYWLTGEEGRLLGVIRVRTSLKSEFVNRYAGNIGYDIAPLSRKKGYGKEILRLGLEKAKVLGLKKVLITCDFDNEGSIKIIEGNGGVLESTIYHEIKEKQLRRYWIELK